MQTGTVLAGRFEIEELAEAGGVGTIFRARDRKTGGPVAIKVLRLEGLEHSERFAREVRALGELRHPAIIRFVSQGRTEDGRPFVAMEWVDGEVFTRRLAEGPLSIPDALKLTQRVADGLAFAHAQGLVHRDVNPDNLLLPGGRLEDAKIVDFGLVRLGEPVVTLSGTIVGTPGFMAPEQVRGRTDIDSRADVFALGCVLFNALTGTPPYAGDPVTSLAKVLFEAPPRARKLRPELPSAIDDLLARMMAQERDDRPRDGAAVLTELRALTELPTAERRIPAPTPSGGVLTVDEQRIASIVVALGKPGRSQVPAADRARTAGVPFGARVELLADGTIVAALSGKGSARDQAKQAARCALALRDVLEDGPLALATGRASVGAAGLIGEVIARATGLLRARATTTTANRRQRPIALDATTAGLLDTQFDIVGEGATLGLRRERPTVHADGTRTLLGRPTPFVGREREMGTLEAIFRECAEEGVAHAVLITGPSGAGKSRLRHEFIRRVRSLEEKAEVWIARGDPMAAGSPLGMIAQILRGTAGVVEAETLRARQAKLSERLARHLAGDDLQRVTVFLGEIAGIRFPEGESVQLQAARRSAVLMGDQMRRAWEDLLSAESEAQPVLLVLEDLHWGDLPTVTFIDSALRNLRNKPVMVLALAQQDVHSLFPDLWAGHPMTELRLGELSRKASEKLVRQAVGDKIPAETVERLIEQAAGNAFYLEELVRSVAEGRDELPPTVLAMVQARLSSLEPESRRVLRAGSVFGATFWKGGVASLLDQSSGALNITAELDELVKREFIATRQAGRFADEYVFRHAIVREAAYDMLTEADRTLGHALAGAWLERAGESDAMVLAEHFERGAEPVRAIACYERAAVQALEGNDLAAVIERARKGISRGARGEQLGALLVLEAEAHRWRGELAEAEVCLNRALAVLPRGTASWYDAASEAISVGVRRGHLEGLDVLVNDLCDESLGAGAGAAKAMAWARAAVPLVLGGLNQLAPKVLERIEQSQLDLDDPTILARVHQALGAQALAAGDLFVYLKHTEAAMVAFDLAGDLRSACLQRSNAGYARTTLGAYGEAESMLREALSTAERLRLPSVAAVVRQYLGLTLAYRGALHEARVVQEQAIEGTTASGEMLMIAWSRVYLAELLSLARNFDSAEREARAALVALGDRVNEVRMYALATLARALLALKRVDEALVASGEASELLAKLGGFSGEAVVRLARAEALRASGDRNAARAAIRSARERLLERAQKISDASLRQGFLENVPANSRTLRLAAEWEDTE